ncbi:MAG: Gfo/Idh/MocA family oxidoreductase, partial [Ruthenibacterium sp.]
MVRIGIIGTENSHALAFAKLLNQPDPKTGALRYPDAHIVGVYGPDIESAQNIMEQVGVDFIAQKPEEFIGRVDAMMITCRRGSVHYEYALPFLKLGMPLFLDKPITTDGAQALKLVAEAKKYGTLLTGGSGCKYAYDVLTLQMCAQNMLEAKTFRSAALNFAIECNSVYDGLFFYASHLIEMALTIFGYDMRSVLATEKNGTLVVTARYENFDVSLHFTDGSSTCGCVLFGKDKNVCREIDISNIYALELEKFLSMLK